MPCSRGVLRRGASTSINIGRVIHRTSAHIQVRKGSKKLPELPRSILQVYYTKVHNSNTSPPNPQRHKLHTTGTQTYNMQFVLHAAHMALVQTWPAHPAYSCPS